MRDVTLRLRMDISDYKAKAAAVASQTKAFTKELERSAEKRQALNEIGGTFGKIGLAAAAAGALTVRAFANFDEGMSAVAATGQDARDNIADLRDLAIDMGAKTKFNATESAAAIENMAKAGVSAADILGGGLAGALDLAAAGNLDVADAAEIAATTMNQFGLKGADMTHIADVLAAAAGKAMGDVTDMAAAFKFVGPVANQMGISLEETGGTIAYLAQQGILGEQAGTSLRGMLSSLTSPSKIAAKEMDKLGISLYDAQGQFVGFDGVAGQLKKTMKDLSNEERDVALGRIFGNEQITTARLLYKGGAEEIRNWTKAVDDSGFAAETAATKMDNLKGDWEELTGALETALIGTGSGADGPLRSLVQNLTDLVDVYNQLPQGAKDAIGGVTALTAAVGTGVWAASRAVTGYASMQENLTTLGWKAKAAGSDVEGLTKRSMGLRVGIGAVGLGLAALSSKAEDTNKGLGVLTETASGAALGFAVAGPWGAAIGGGVMALKNLAGAAGDADRATARTAGFAQAKEAAAQLTEQLYGTVQAYNDVTAASVRQGLMGDDGKPVDWVTELQGAGVSMDTITRAILGQRDAVKLVNQAWGEQAAAIGQYDAKIAETQGKIDAILTSSPDGVSTDPVKQREISDLNQALTDLKDARREEKADLEAAKKAYDALNAPVAAQTKNEKELAQALGLKRKQYNDMPKEIRTKIEADGLPQTEAGLQDLLKLSGDLDGKEVVSLVKASGVRLSKRQILDLQETYGLTPKEVETLLAARDAASKKAQNVKNKLTDLDGTTATPTVNLQDNATVKIGNIGSSLSNLADRVINTYVNVVERKKKAGGGSITGSVVGPGSGTSDSIPALLSNGEHVWTAREVAAAGGQGAVYGLRAAALAGALPKFADGGAVEAVSAREMTSLKIRVRDLNRALNEKETYGKGKKKKRLALRGLDRIEAKQELREAKAELAEQNRIRRVIGKGKKYRTAGQYNRAMERGEKAREDARDTAKDAKENRQSVAGSFADGLDGDAFRSPANLERSLRNLERDNAEYTQLLAALKAAGASPWLLEQIRTKAGPSRATNRTLRALLGDSARLARMNGYAGGIVTGANNFGALVTQPGFTPTFSGQAGYSAAQIAQIVNQSIGQSQFVLTLGNQKFALAVQAANKFAADHA